MAKKTTGNPVLKEIEGIEVRRSNYLTITFNEHAYEELIKEAKATGLSMAKLVALKSQPCQQCGCNNVTVTIIKDGRINKQNTGANIITQNAKRYPGAH